MSSQHLIRNLSFMILYEKFSRVIFLSFIFTQSAYHLHNLAWFLCIYEHSSEKVYYNCIYLISRIILILSNNDAFNSIEAWFKWHTYLTWAERLWKWEQIHWRKSSLFYVMALYWFVDVVVLEKNCFFYVLDCNIIVWTKFVAWSEIFKDTII